MRDPALRRVGHGTAEEFRIDFLVGHGLHDVRTGDEHVARVLDHDGEVGHRRRVDGAAGARSHDDGDLGHDPGREDVAQEDVGVATERRDAFLDPRATGIVETDDRRTDLHGQVHDLADLLGVRLRQRSTEDREVLAEDEHEPTVDRPVSGDDAVAQDMLLGHPEFGGAVGDERIEFDERPWVEQEVQSFARRQLPPGVLSFDTDRATAQQCLGPHALEPVEPLFIRRHGQPDLHVSLRKDRRHHSHAHRRRSWDERTDQTALRPSATTLAFVHRFGEQLSKRVDNRGARKRGTGRTMARPFPCPDGACAASYEL